MKRIEAVMARDWFQRYPDGDAVIPVVTVSTHPDLKTGSRLDYVILAAALESGYDVEIRQPDERRSR